MATSKEPTAAQRAKAASSAELAEKQHEVVVLLQNIRFLTRLLIGVVVISLAVISLTGIVASRTATEAKHVGEQNNTFLGNFSDYMRCLVVNDDQVVLAVGEEAYFNLCDALLFRGTGQESRTATKVTIPENFTTTTSTAPPQIFVPNSSGNQP